MAEIEYATTQALSRVEEHLMKEIEASRANIQKNNESIVKLEVMYQTLAPLASALTSLEKTMVGVQQTLSGVQQNLEGMNSKIDYMQDKIANQKASIKDLREENKQQNEHIAKIDNKGKIDWIEAVNKNFWKVLVALGVLYYLGKDILSAVLK